MLFLLPFQLSKNPEKMYHGFHSKKISSSTTVLKFDKKYFFTTISLFKCFLKDHVTLTGKIMLKIQLCHHMK